MTAIASAATMDIQIPSRAQNIGKIITVEHWNTMVRKNEINAEVRPSLRAVKKEELKMEKPDSKKEKENIVKA